MTPFDKVKNQLVARIKDIYLPDPASLGGVVNKLSKLDFTGESEPNTRTDQGTIP
jgi:hypothetical protein